MAPPHMSAATIAGDLVFTSGQLAFFENRLEGDTAEQTQRVLLNIETVLADFNLDRTDIVKTTVWLVRGEDFVPFNDTYAAFFGEHRPARSTVVANLVIPAALIEIEAVARLRPE